MSLCDLVRIWDWVSGPQMTANSGNALATSVYTRQPWTQNVWQIKAHICAKSDADPVTFAFNTNRLMTPISPSSCVCVCVLIDMKMSGEASLCICVKINEGKSAVFGTE